MGGGRRAREVGFGVTGRDVLCAVCCVVWGYGRGSGEWEVEPDEEVQYSFSIGLFFFSFYQLDSDFVIATYLPT
jgi:hypothetical protein